MNKENMKYIIKGVDGNNKPCEDFTNKEKAIEYGLENYDLFSVVEVDTNWNKEVVYSNFLDM